MSEAGLIKSREWNDYLWTNHQPLVRKEGRFLICFTQLFHFWAFAVWLHIWCMEISLMWQSPAVWVDSSFPLPSAGFKSQQWLQVTTAGSEDGEEEVDGANFSLTHYRDSHYIGCTLAGLFRLPVYLTVRLICCPDCIAILEPSSTTLSCTSTREKQFHCINTLHLYYISILKGQIIQGRDLE